MGFFLGQCGLLILTRFVPNCVFRLTLGLMGLDELHLRVLATSSEDIRQRQDAQTGDLLHYIYPPYCSRKLSSETDEERETLGSGRSCYCHINNFYDFSESFAPGSSTWKRGMGP